MNHAEVEPKVVFLMSGLPSMGKSYFSEKIATFFGTRGYNTAIFNAGRYRRAHWGTKTSADFFDTSIEKYVQLREKIAKECFQELLTWIRTGDIAIFDATNTSSHRRQWLKERLATNNLDYAFVEFICNDPAMLDKLLNMKIKQGDDFKDKPRPQAKQELLRRRINYSKVYKPFSPNEKNVIMIHNLGERITNSCPDKEIFNDLHDLLKRETSKSRAFLLSQ